MSQETIKQGAGKESVIIVFCVLFYALLYSHLSTIFEFSISFSDLTDFFYSGDYLTPLFNEPWFIKPNPSDGTLLTTLKTSILINLNVEKLMVALLMTVLAALSCLCCATFLYGLYRATLDHLNYSGISFKATALSVALIVNIPIALALGFSNTEFLYANLTAFVAIFPFSIMNRPVKES